VIGTESLANPNRQLAFNFEELYIASMVHEDITVDKCLFEYLKIGVSKQSRSHLLDPRDQLILIPLFWLQHASKVCSLKMTSSALNFLGGTFDRTM